MRKVELVVLDLAGTTVEDGGYVSGAFTSALAEHGIAVSSEDLDAFRGASKRQAIAELVQAHAPDAGDRFVRTVYEAFHQRLSQALGGGVRPVPGAAETIAWLRARGIRVALNTGFDGDITSLVIDALGWRHGVDAVVCGDDVPEGRPAPYLIYRAMERTATRSVAKVMNVGDTMLDLQAGQNARVAFNIGVLSGAHSIGHLESQPHTHLLGSVAELPSLWNRD